MMYSILIQILTELKWVLITDAKSRRILGVCYHPPKPQYKDVDLLARNVYQLEVLCQIS